MSTATDQCRLLWRIVIDRAIKDAAGEDLPNGTPFKRACVIVEAQNWFTRADHEFQEVCELADLDPDAVREKAIAKFKAIDLDDYISPAA